MTSSVKFEVQHTPSSAGSSREQPANKAMKSDVEKRGSNFRCTISASTFSGSAKLAALFNAAYR
jgi:hypothetical protein